MSESFHLRMRYEFNSRFTNQTEIENLHKMAKTASNHLLTIVEKQKRLKQKIEDYHGEDWDQRYGLTGLWRKLSADIYTTDLTKCQIDYYLALTADLQQRNTILHNILSQIDQMDSSALPAASHLLKAKTIAILSQTQTNYKSLAEKEFNTLMTRSDISQSTTFQLLIERIKFGFSDKENLTKLIDQLTESNYADDAELVLSLAFLQRRFNQPENFKKTVSLLPQTQIYLGTLILEDLSSSTSLQKDLKQVSIFEAELAAQAAWNKSLQEYKVLLDYLVGTEKFQTPLILYVTALASVESSPAKAVQLLTKASTLQKLQKNDLLKISAEKIAKQAAQLSYNLYIEDHAHCQLAIEAFENYSIIAGEKIDKDLEYKYSIILKDCGKTQKAHLLLKKIAGRTIGPWRNKAKLQLLVKTIQQNQYETLDEKSKLIRQFAELSEKCHIGEYTNEAMQLLSDIVDQIDNYQEKDNFPATAKACKKIAQFCYNHNYQNDQLRQHAGLLLLETAILSTENKQEKILELEKLFNNISEEITTDNVDMLRCRARLLAKQNKFREAAQLWMEICKMRKNEVSSTNQRSWKWWRAKFYELSCMSKTKEIKKTDIIHTIEVLENSLTDIPSIWSKKIGSLKQQ